VVTAAPKPVASDTCMTSVGGGHAIAATAIRRMLPPAGMEATTSGWQAALQMFAPTEAPADTNTQSADITNSKSARRHSTSQSSWEETWRLPLRLSGPMARPTKR